jgi:putative redox protein
MSDDESTMRSVHLVRTGPQQYRAENPRGGVISFGEGEGTDFTPVELLLVALGGCNALTVEALTKRAEPRRFDIAVEAQKRKGADGGNQLEDLIVTVDIAFDRDEEGQAMAERVPDAIDKSHHKLCTVSRTIERPTPVRVVQVRNPEM